jgi:enoyl-CoA hydratase/carnithine racemase
MAGRLAGMTDRVRVTIEDDVARVTLDNPELRNALTAELADGLVAAMETVADSDARCVVVAGEGAAFCAGGDLNAMVEGIEAGDGDGDGVEDGNDTGNGGGRDPETTRAAIERTASAVTAVANCDVPTVAAVEGAAYGAGAALAIACDVVVASEEAGISFGFRRVGLAVDSGVSYHLPRIVGESTAKTLVFTGEMVEADRAADLGLFNRVVPEDSFEEELDAFVDQVASGPTAALSASKRLVEEGSRRSLSEAVAAETDTQVAMVETSDHAEGVRAFVERRDPDFRGE